MSPIREIFSTGENVHFEKIPTAQTPILRQNGHPHTTQCTTRRHGRLRPPLRGRAGEAGGAAFGEEAVHEHEEEENDAERAFRAGLGDLGVLSWVL